MSIRWGIKSRLLALAIIPSMMVTIILIAYFIVTTTDEQQQSIELRARAITQQLAFSSEFAMNTNNIELLQQLVNLTKHNDVNIVDIMFFNNKQQAMFSTANRTFVKNNRWPEKQPPTKIESIHSENTISIYYPITNISLLSINKNLSDAQQKNAVLGYVVLKMDLTNITLSSSAAILTSLAALIGSLLVAILLSRRMAQNVTRPIIKIADTVNHIKKGNFEARIETQDITELNELSLGINSMVQALQKGRDEFEMNLDEATSNLTQTLERIEIQNVELDITKKQAQEASRIKSEFLANVSHEIRTPMNGVIGFCNLLIKTKLSEKQADYLQTIKNSSTGLLAIIDDILDFSKIEAGKMQLEKNVVDLREELDEVLTLLGPVAGYKKLELVSFVYEDIPEGIIGDSIRIKQIFTNLINNAIKFTDSGSIIVRVMLEDTFASGVEIKIVVSDTGPGLTDQQQKKLFKSFSQADTSTTRKYGGTGLGLAICKKLVANMGGEIGIDSSHGDGADFWFTIKVKTAKNKFKYKAPKNWSVRELYLMEPHTILALSLKHILTQWGFKVHVFSDEHSLLKGLASIEIDKASVGNEKAPLIICNIEKQSETFQVLNDYLEENLWLNAQLLILTKEIDSKEHQWSKKVADINLVNKPASRKSLHKAIEKIFPRVHQVSNVTSKDEPHFNQSHLKILIADDNKSNLKLITEILNDKNIKSDTACDGQEAVSLSRKNKYDLILMDIQMPKLDGLESTGIIRANSLNTSTPIIAVTAHALKGEKESLITAGMDGYLSKPIDEDDLQNTINQWCFNQKTTIDKAISIERENSNNQQDCNLNLKIIDWDHCLQLANGKEDLADDFLNGIVRSIQDVIEQSHLALEQKNLDSLITVIHKFHGGICYSGLPLLKIATLNLEKHLKSKGFNQSERYFESFINELNSVDSEYKTFIK